MPPSGYNYAQAEAISEFLRSCVGALILENRGLRAPSAAISREVESITRDLGTENRLAFERELLALTRSFYEALLKDAPASLDDLAEHAEDILADFSARILNIHVAV